MEPTQRKETQETALSPTWFPLLLTVGELELSVICNTELQLTEARACDIIKEEDSREMLRGLRAESDCFSKEFRSRWTC